MLSLHKSVGLTVLVVTFLRLTWRATHIPPPLPLSSPKYQRNIAHLAHGLFYCLLFAIPITGLLMSSANGKSVSWFGWLTCPNVIAPNEGTAKILTQMHASLAVTLFLTVLAHVAAALKHHLWDRDDVLIRMLPAFKRKN
jgi:cytochrome b561